MGWLYLAIAIGCEVTATLALRASEGFTKLAPAVIVVVGYVCAFILLGLALRTIGVGPAYAIWAGVGTAGAAIGAWLLFGERIGAFALVGIALVIAGVVCITLGVRAH
jgi:multidrug transporter EmrE-like cation transporter